MEEEREIKMIEKVKKAIRNIEDFPQKGIVFRDITTAIKDKEALKAIIDYLTEQLKGKKIDYIVGIESRGFIFGSALACNLGAGLVLIRKPGKLPCKTISETYELEYGTDEIHMHEDAVEEGANVVVVDDLLATGGTVCAAIKLLKKAKANVVSACFVIELTELDGRNKIPDGVETITMVKY